MEAFALRWSRLILVLALLPSAAGFAETDKERQAREDLERQLKAMVGNPPTKIRIELVGLDQPNYALIEAAFRLDGRNLPVSDLKRLNSDGDHLIFHGDVEPGEHRLETKLEYQNMTTQMVSAEGGYKWKPGSEVSFKAASGIEVTIKVTPELNLNADLKNRITVKSPATVKMLAKLDDGSMPPPAPKPNLVAVVDAADAGVAAQTPAEKAAAAAEAKKQAAADAAAAKKAAADEKKRLADEAKAAKLAAAEEKKRLAEEAKAAKLAAAADKKRAAEDAKLAAAAEKKRAAEDKKRAEEERLAAAANPNPAAPTEPAAVAPVEVDGGAVAVAEVDAGAAVVAVAPTPAPVKPVVAEPVVEESGISPIVIGAAIAGLALLIFLVARRKKEKS